MSFETRFNKYVKPPLKIVWLIKLASKKVPFKSSVYVFILSHSLLIFAQTNSRTDGTIEGVNKIEITKDIYQFQASFDGYVGNCNSTVIINENDVLVFDTNTRPSTTRAILTEIRKITDKPVKFVVNSHWHPDHWSGNEVYSKEFPNIEIISTVETREFMKIITPGWLSIINGILSKRQENFKNEVENGNRSDGTILTTEQKQNNEDSLNFYRFFVEELNHISRIFPNRVYQNKMILRQGRREFQLLSVFGDADYSTVLYLPKEKIIMTGDLLVHPIQWAANGYHLNAWLNSLKMLQQLDIKVIIPGHGPPFTDKIYLNQVIELFETIIKQVKDALEKGLTTFAEVRQLIKLDELRSKFTKGEIGLNRRFLNNTNDLIKMAYLEARDGLETK